MKIMIACPCFDAADVNFVQCLVGLQAVNAECKIVFASSSLVYDARNSLVQRAIAEKFDYILWLDSDMTFEPTILKDLLATKKNFVSGLCFTRRPPFRPTFFDKCGYVVDGDVQKPSVHCYWEYPKDSLFEVEAFGFGAVLTKVAPLKKIIEKFGLPFTPVVGFGEDLSFCLRARECDYKLYTDSRVKCGHVAKLVINEAIFLNAKGENA